MINKENGSLFAAIAATGLLFLSASMGSRAITIAAYVPIILAGVIATFSFAALSIRAWGQKPPGELVAWIFGHLTLWSVAFTVEEFGWFLWRVKEPSEVITLFEYTLSPALKVIQTVSILGLVLLMYLVQRGQEGTKLTINLRLFWLFNVTLASIYFLMLHLLV